MRYVGFPWQWEDVNNVDREVIIGKVQRQLINAYNLIKELEKCFPHQEETCILDYLQYWLTDTFMATYPRHIAKLKTFYETTKKLWVSMNIETKDVEE